MRQFVAARAEFPMLIPCGNRNFSRHAACVRSAEIVNLAEIDAEIVNLVEFDAAIIKKCRYGLVLVQSPCFSTCFSF